MKKIYLLFCAVAVASVSFAQTFSNAGMETPWRNNTSAGTAVHAPNQWYGFDSLILADGAMYAPILHFGTPWNGSAQNFQETTIIHGGASSAKLMTLRQDTLGFFPGILSNAVPSVNVAAILTGGSPAGAVTYSGGTPVSLQINTVSAWVVYKPGVDSAGLPAQDTGLLIAQVYATIGGTTDSLIGTGTVQIPPSVSVSASSFTQITANIVYTDSLYPANNIRVNFASSGGGANRALDSSTLYVDDVTMTGTPFVSHVGVKNVIANNLINVYPNPASSAIHIDGPQNAGYSCQLLSVSGQVVMVKALTGNDVLNVATLAEGLYLYNIIDKNGNSVQKGKVTINR